MSDKSNDEKLIILQERLAQIKQKKDTPIPQIQQREEVIEVATTEIEKKLLGDGTTGPDVIPDELGYNVCIWRSSTGNYGIIAKQDSGSCEITMSDMGTYTRKNC